MEITKTPKIIGSIVVLVILLGLYIAFDRNLRNRQNQTGKTDQTIATSTDSNQATTSGAIHVNAPEGVGYTIEKVPTTESGDVSKPIPDLNRPITLSSGAIILPEAKVLATEKVKSLQNLLRNNPSDLSAWLDLAMYQKMAGDYAGAVISWHYATKLAPYSYTAFGNLGNLYAYFLKDNAKAEMYYKEAISKGQTQGYLYTQLAEVYRDIFYDKVKALAITNEGLSKITNDPNLLQIKASLETQ